MRPILRNIATIGDGRDITRAFMGGIMQPQDTVLMSRASGDWRTYEDVLRDDQVGSTMQQRRLAVTSRPWEVEPGDNSARAAEAAEAIRENLKAINWDRITDKMLFALWYGFSVGECLWGVDNGRVVIDDIKVRKQRRFRYDMERGLVLLTMKNPLGEAMPKRKFWEFSIGADNDDEPYGLGLAHWCYWPVFFKRNGLKFWLTFLDKFGMPTAKGTAPMALLQDESKKKQILDALKSIQTEAAILVPDGVVLDLVESTRSGTATYAELQSKMDAAISKIVLSQTMTTDDGSSRSQSETHKDVRDEVVKSDSDMLCASFNAGPVAWLTEWNFGPDVAPPRVWRVIEEPEDLTERAERDSKVYALGYKPTLDYITETYGEGWEERDDTPPPMGPGEAGALNEFAEFIATHAHRNDQRQILAAAEQLAGKFDTTVGPRLAELLSYLEDTDDLETFRKRINELAAEGPRPEAVDKLTRAGVMGRLLGMFRAQTNVEGRE